MASEIIAAVARCRWTFEVAVPIPRIVGERVLEHLVLVSGERGAVSRDELAAQ
jgi:hypothetical protein